MDKTQERTFFAQLESVTKDCFIFIDNEFEEDNTCKMSDNSRSIVQQVIVKKAGNLNVRIIDVLSEIAENLDECQTAKQVELYVIDLLRHFKDYSDRFHPERLIKVQEENIKAYQNKSEMVLRRMCEKEIERLKDRKSKYYDLCFTEKRLRVAKDTAEDFLIKWIDIIIYFSKRFDALLLERGFDLLQYQDKICVYLIRQDRIEIDTDYEYLGGIERARKLIQETKRNNKSEEQVHTENKSNKKEPSFSDIIQYYDKQKLLDRLHFLIDGKGGAQVGAVILKAKVEGYLSDNPVKKAFYKEFPNTTGTWQAIHNYFDESDNKCLAKARGVIIFDDKKING